MGRCHIECNKCHKDIPNAMWIEDKIEFTRTPYCTECYMKIKEKEIKDGIGHRNESRPGSDGAKDNSALHEPVTADTITDRADEFGGGFKVSWRYGATDH